MKKSKFSLLTVALFMSYGLLTAQPLNETADSASEMLSAENITKVKEKENYYIMGWVFHNDSKEFLDQVLIKLGDYEVESKDGGYFMIDSVPEGFYRLEAVTNEGEIIQLVEDFEVNRNKKIKVYLDIR